MTPTCCWVLQPARAGVPAVYCGARVGWRMVRDDDRNRVRQYDSLCAAHQAESAAYAAAHPDDDELP